MRFAVVALLLAVPAVAGGATFPASAPATRPRPLPGVKWTVMPIRSAQQAKAGLCGGEGGQCLQGMSRCAADDRRIYLGVDVVGVWRSEDGGASWRPCRNLGLYCLGTTSVAVNPRVPDQVLVYADAFFEKPREPEEGLYQSYDGGDTWVRVLAVPNDDERKSYRHLIAYAANGWRVYFAACKGGVYRSDDSGARWQGPLALKGVAVTELRVDPADPDVVWAATEQGLYRSANSGKGFDHVEPLGKSPVGAVSADPDAPQRIWAVKAGEGLFRSDDRGKTFEQVSCGDKDLDAQANGIFISPADPRRMILSSFRRMRITHDGGKTWRDPKVDWSGSYVQQGAWAFHEGYAWSQRNKDQVVGALSCGMYASTDGGLSWQDSMCGYTGFHHGWSNGAVSFAAEDPDRFAFFCYDYALVLTRDGGRSFTNGRLKEKIRGWWGMYAGDMHPRWNDSPVVVAAAGFYWRNQLVRSENAGATWTAAPDTDGSYFFVRFHPTRPNIVYADDRRSDDGGKSFRKLPRPVYAFAPSRPDTVYGYGDGKVWRSDDCGDTWRALPPPPRKAGEMMGRRDIQVHPTDPDRLWAMTPPDAATFDGKAWRTVPASRWAPPQAHAYVGRFAIDLVRPERVILGLDAHGTGYLFLSEDGGHAWSDITANLPRLGSNQSLNIQPGTSRIFIGAGFGTWTTSIAHAGRPADGAAPFAPARAPR